MINFALVALAVSCLFYCWFVLNVLIGLNMLKSDHPVTPHPHFVSVIVAVKDEDDSLGNCLTSLLEQDYPKEQYEVIVVDDSSVDRTPEIIQSASSKDKRIRCIRLDRPAYDDVGRKPEAIAVGVEHAKGDLILTTDGDCVVPALWIRRMAQCFSPEVAFVAGPVIERTDASLLNRLEGLEFFGLIVTGAGLIGRAHPIICNGANLAYRKSAFLAVSGYGSKAGFCDDETLMQRIARRKVGKVSFCANPQAMVETYSRNDLESFWKQRLRWAAKKGHYENPVILAELVGLYLFFLTLLILAIASIFFSQLRLAVIAAFLAKIIIDFITLSLGARLFNQKISAPHLLLAEFLHVPYVVFTAGFAQFSSIHWKGRKLSQ